MHNLFSGVGQFGGVSVPGDDGPDRLKVAGKRLVEDLRIHRSIYRPQRPGYQPPTETVDPSVFSA
ncbi:MAG TPA: hypothetical protein DCE44_07130, partial [Verrucomicrobiales bacterium]|nr:hypothetical protein [Verrucomicrobiales bacterium]